MKRCVSYSYFRSPSSVYEREKGNAAKQFEQFLPLLVRAHHALWSTYDLVIHHDFEIEKLPYWPALVRMSAAKLLRLRCMGESRTLCQSMLWRMQEIWEPEYVVVVCRDVDSIPSLRDRRAVEEFVADGGRAVHVIHDNPAHGGLMGGTLAVIPARFRTLTGFSTFEEFEAECKLAYPEESWNTHGTDQHFLNRVVYPSLKGSVLVHELSAPKPGLELSEHRSKISGFDPADVHPRAAEVADKLCPGIGVCDEPGPRFAFYDTLEGEVFDRIRTCEVNP
jgi:hypothetical protein